MSEPTTAVAQPVLSARARGAGVAVGALTLVAGGVATFLTDNELGSTALVVGGIATAALAVFGNRLHAVEAAGIRLELERQALRVQLQAQEALRAGETRRAEELERSAQSILATARRVGSRYERLVATQPSGWERTSRMESTLREARALDTSQGLAASDVAQIFATGTEGNRIAALALIEGNPRLATVDVLAAAILHPRSSFEQYHALVAAETALDLLPEQDRHRLRDVVSSVLEGPLGEKSSSRRTVARRVLERLTRD